eukprot:GHVN01083015.1.p1 GENE.GHVN01083015.1~~GHVN01083015.1.p1  ORF type:complete len:338 (+),score=122.65 GHVN01083015.1:1111-2124(+)
MFGGLGKRKKKKKREGHSLQRGEEAGRVKGGRVNEGGREGEGEALTSSLVSISMNGEGGEVNGDNVERGEAHLDVGIKVEGAKVLQPSNKDGGGDGGDGGCGGGGGDGFDGSGGGDGGGAKKSNRVKKSKGFWGWGKSSSATNSHPPPITLCSPPHSHRDSRNSDSDPGERGGGDFHDMLSPYRPSNRLSASGSPSAAWANFETPSPNPNPTPYTASNRYGGAGRSSSSSWWGLGSTSSKTKSNSKKMMGHGGQSAPPSPQSVMNTTGTPGKTERASEVRGGLSCAHSSASEARSKLMQNKEQLEAAVIKTDEMNNAAASFASYAAHLNQKYSGGRK